MNASTASSSAICAKCAILESWRVEYNERRRTISLATGLNEDAGTQMNRLMGAARPKPRAARRGRRSGELRINATRWQTNEKQNTNEPAELQL